MKIIEATILFPMTIFIIVMLIGLMMNFYDSFNTQVINHSDDITVIYSERVVKYINAYDKAKELIIK